MLEREAFEEDLGSGRDLGREERFFPEERFAPAERFDERSDLTDVPREGTGVCRLKTGRDREEEVPITEVGRIIVDVVDVRLTEGVAEREVPKAVWLVTVRGELSRLILLTERLIALGVDTRICGALLDDSPTAIGMLLEDLRITAESRIPAKPVGERVGTSVRTRGRTPPVAPGLPTRTVRAVTVRTVGVQPIRPRSSVRSGGF